MIVVDHLVWWQNWLVLIVGFGLVYVVWSWVPVERLDRHWRWMNPIGRPFLDTLVLTGLPAVYARLTLLPLWYISIPICFFLTQYAALSGRFLKREFFIAGWVVVLITATIWLGFSFA